jgi:hypothetical protein
LVAYSYVGVLPTRGLVSSAPVIKMIAAKQEGAGLLSSRR